ncbi:hypothetical protein PVAND_005917 [Polypedilum vanderplanki]|uniref:Carbonic anhydrase n=1 Tax=Polypedilum vanderplanki TaxID=319348 RepID=A0A9J6C1Z9_POLVA|nr:hypothetical protein PVAND_005917 [Polypedilum vanderplanki]
MWRSKINISFGFLITSFVTSQDFNYPKLPSARQLSMNGSLNNMTYSYNNEDTRGPSNWRIFNATCGGFSQSPINIETSNVWRGKAPPLFMDYFTKPVVAITLTNTGHSVNYRLKFIDSAPNRLIWNGMNGKTYIFDSLHIHWGNSCVGGSEHTINGHRYLAEIHLVHFNAKYKYLEAAALQQDGLAVIGIFLETADEANNDGSNNNKFVKFLNNVRQPGQTYLITDTNGIFTVQELIKYEIREYYSYKGSLTTPPCSESVRWIVAKRPVRIYPSEWNLLNQVISFDGRSMTGNNRPVQQINGRNVYEYNYVGNYRHKFDRILWNIP